MRLRPIFSKLLMVVPFLLAACYPKGPDFTEDYDVVITDYNPKYVFKSKSTFAIPDKIVKINGSVASGDPPEYIPAASATSMLSRIVKNMTDLGYVQVDISASPDLIILPAALTTTTISYWYPYWGWYGGWYYPYYPGYGYGYTTSYTTGTLVMNMVDPKELSATGNPIDQWVGALNGILTNSFSASRTNGLIDKAFSQSPYLKK